MELSLVSVFEMFGYLIIVEEIEFFFIKKTDCLQSEIFWIIPVQDWSKTSPANAVCSLRTLNYSKVIDIDLLLVKKSKIDAACLITNELI